MAAGAIIGRVPCPLHHTKGCDNQAAHVKRAEGKHPYVYCPACGCTLATRNGVQAAYLLASMRPVEAATAPAAPPAPKPAPPAGDIVVAPPAAPAAPAPEPAKPAKRSSWAPLIGVTK